MSACIIFFDFKFFSFQKHGGAVGGFTVAGKRLVVTSAIDNLLKGAASQAVQNINLAMGFDELAGLEPLPTSIGASTSPSTSAKAAPFAASGVASANAVPCKPCPTVCPTCATPACKQCFPICAGCTDANRFFVNNYARPGTVVLARGEGARVSFSYKRSLAHTFLYVSSVYSIFCAISCTTRTTPSGSTLRVALQ